MSKIWRGIGLACVTAASLLVINTKAVQADPQASVRVTSAIGQGVVRLDAKASGPFSYVIHHPSTDLYYIDLSGVSASSTAAAQVLGTDIVRSYRLEQYQSGDTTVSRLELLLGNGAAPQITRQGNDALQIVVSRKNVMDARTESSDEPRMVNASLHVSAAPSAVIRQISVAKDGDTPEVLVLGSGSMNYHASRLAHPSRLVLDFDNERMTAAKKTASQLDPIQDVRAAQYSPEVARVVIDLSKDAAYSVRHVDGGVAVEFASSAPSTADAQQAASSQQSSPKTSDPAPQPQAPASSTVTSGAAAPQSDNGSTVKQDTASSTQGTASSSKPATQPSSPSPSPVDPAAPQTSTDSSKNSATSPSLAGDSSKPAGFDATVASQSSTQPAQPSAQTSTTQQASSSGAAAQQSTQEAQTQGQAATQTAAAQPPVAVPAPQGAALEPTSAPVSVVRQDQLNPAKYTGSPISVNLKNVDLQDFFRLVHEISGLNVVVDPSVKGTLTLVLDNVPWDQALDIVLQNNDLDKQLDGNVLRIATKATMKKEADEQKELAKAQIEAADVVTTTRTLSYAKASDLVDTVKKFLSPRGDVLADSRTNTLIISDIPTALPVIDNLLRELDKKTQQVEIESRVVLANRNFSRELGSQFAFSGSANNGKNLFSGIPAVGTSPVGRFVPPLPAPPVISGTSAPSPTSTSPTAVNMPLVTNLATTVPTSGVSYAFSTANFALDYVISAAEAKGVGKLLSAPKEIVQNNEQATIKQGTKIPIQTVINNTISVQFVDAVLELQVTPQITDQGTIFLTVHVENTQIDPSIPRIQGIPALDTQAQDTRVLVSDGQTVMIGGIIVSNQQTNIDEVPFVGSLPIIGQLFRHTTISTSSQELLFFVTPRILPM